MVVSYNFNVSLATLATVDGDVFIAGMGMISMCHVDLWYRTLQNGLLGYLFKLHSRLFIQ